MKDAKQDRFVRIAEQRTQNVLDALKSLAKCAATESYSYSQKDAEKILQAIEKELKATRDAFAGKKKFSLNPPPDRVTVDLGFATLVAEEGSDPNYKEVFVGLEDADGVCLQDLAVIGSKYHYDNDGIVFEDAVSIKVFSDKNKDDYTHEFSIGIHEDETEVRKSLADQILSASDRSGNLNPSKKDNQKRGSR